MMFFSSYCIDAKDTESAICRLATDADIRNIELNNGRKHVSGITGNLAGLKKKYGLNFLIHNYFPPPKIEFVLNLASQNQSALSRSITHCKNAIKLAGELKAPVYSVHAGLRLDPSSPELGKPVKQANLVPYEAAYKTLARSLAILCDYARDFSVEIAVENNVLAPFNLNRGKNELLLMCEAREFLTLFKDVRKANLKALIDMGHLNVTSATLGFDKADFINKLKDRIALFHLSDNKGVEDTHGLISERSWFWDALRDFKDTKCVIESRNLTLEQIKLTKRIYQSKGLR